VGDIDTVVVDSLKALDLERPIREADLAELRVCARSGSLLGESGAVRRCASFRKQGDAEVQANTSIKFRLVGFETFLREPVGRLAKSNRAESAFGAKFHRSQANL
jgi:hypothetical protein